MPTLLSGRVLTLSMGHIIEPGTKMFTCPEGHYWFQKVDRALNAPPYQPEQQVLCDFKHAPCPTTREEALGILYLLEAARNAPFELSPWLELTRVRAEQGKLALAEEAARKALGVGKQSAAAWANLGAVLMEMERPQEAQEAAEKALAIDRGVWWRAAATCCAADSDAHLGSSRSPSMIAGSTKLRAGSGTSTTLNFAPTSRKTGVIV